MNGEGEQAKLSSEELLANLAKLNVRIWKTGGRLARSETWMSEAHDPNPGTLTMWESKLQMAASIPMRENVCLVPLTARDHVQANVICVHPLHGTAYDYRHIAADMPDNFAVYGLQATGKLIAHERPDSVETMARWYTQEIVENELCAKPFVLYGGCTGGFVALAIARQLREIGVVPKALFLAETRDWTDTTKSMRMYGWWLSFVEAFMPYELAKSLLPTGHEFWALDNDARYARIIRDVAAMVCPLYSLPLDRTVLERYFLEYGGYLQCYPDYVPEQFEGRSVYLKAITANWSQSEKVRAALVGNAELLEISGNHVSLFRPTRASDVVAAIVRELVVTQ